MHIQTHILSGWCIGNFLPLTPRERLLCMVAASIQDIDGLGILYSEELYWDLHHKLGHCLLFGGITAAVCGLIARRWRMAAVALVLFHVHLVLDYYGSGPGWGLYYYWPFNEHEWVNRDAWPFFSWQNISAFVLLLGWTVLIAWQYQRTLLELLVPSLDRKLTGQSPMSEGLAVVAVEPVTAERTWAEKSANG